MHVHIWPSRTRLVDAANAFIRLQASCVASPLGSGVEWKWSYTQIDSKASPSSACWARPLMTCQWSRGLDAGEVLPPALGDEESEAHARHVTCAAARRAARRPMHRTRRPRRVRCAPPDRMGRAGVWTSAQVRAAEEPLLARGRAAHGARGVRAARPRRRALLAERRGRGRRCAGRRPGGSGNNGGDALYAGALLARRGVEVRAVLTATRVHEGGLAALLQAGGRPAGRRSVDDAAALAAGADLVLDGLVGIGADGCGPARSRRPSRATALRTSGDPFVVAVDVPSGIGVDDGTRDGDRCSTPT